MTIRRIAAAVALISLAAGTSEALPAFPGAQGFGADTPGGRGGRVIEVTTLDSEGPGSFNEAVRAEGPRIIVFRVAGTIDMQGTIPIRHPFCTIAGQTAPGDGICLVNGTLRVNTHDVIIRHLRVRPGDHPTGTDPENRDCIDIAGDADSVHDVIVDHCSFSWGIDENVATWYGPKRVTIQWCITSESLFESLHPKGRHGMAMILGSEENTVTVHHCLLSHNNGRHPLAGDQGREEMAPSVFDFRNNVLYDYGGFAGNFRSDLRVNHVGNVIIPGPDSRPGIRGIRYDPNSDQRFYLHDNLWPGRAEDAPETQVLGTIEPDHEPPPAHVIAGQAFDTPTVTTHPAEQVEEVVLAHVGTTLPVRDVIDDRVIREVRERVGGFINTPSEVSGLPQYASAEPRADSDHDAMPDEWEREHDLNPEDASDGPGDLDGDGYTNVEEFLNRTDPAQSDAGEPIEQPEVVVQSGNEPQRFDNARHEPEPARYDPADREDFVERVRASGQAPAAFLGMKLIHVKPGTFTRNGIEVRMTQRFEIGATEVTQSQWEAVMGTRPWEGETWAPANPEAPATYIGWHDAVEFCARLSAAGDAEYALPTEAQWLLACRAGRESGDLWWFAQEDATDYAWLRPNTEGADEPWPHAVGTRPPNALGLHDMPGNVLEWTADAYDYWRWRPERTETLKIDPARPADGGLVVICGGSLYYTPRQLVTYPTRARYAHRKTFDTGFRVTRTHP